MTNTVKYNLNNDDSNSIIQIENAFQNKMIY